MTHPNLPPLTSQTDLNKAHLRRMNEEARPLWQYVAVGLVAFFLALGVGYTAVNSWTWQEHRESQE